MLNWLSQVAAADRAQPAHPRPAPRLRAVDDRRRGRAWWRCSWPCCRSPRGSARTMAATGLAGHRARAARRQRLRDDERPPASTPRGSSPTRPAWPRTAAGPQSSAELFVVVDLPKRSTGTDANVPLRGVQPAAFGVRKQRQDRHRAAASSRGRNEVDRGPGGGGASSPGSTSAAHLRWGENEWTVVGIFTADGGSLPSRRSGATPASCSRPTGAATPSSRCMPGSSPPRRSPLQGRADRRSAPGRQGAPRDRLLRRAVADARPPSSPASARSSPSLMALGAVFGALNTMYTAVASRTREIATLRALGFRQRPGGRLGPRRVAGALPGRRRRSARAVAYFAFNGYQASTLNWQSFSQVAFAFAVTPRAARPGDRRSRSLMGLVGGLLPGDPRGAPAGGDGAAGAVAGCEPMPIPCACAKPGDRIRTGAPHFRSAGDVEGRSRGCLSKRKIWSKSPRAAAAPSPAKLALDGKEYELPVDRRLRGRGRYRYPAAPRPERRDHARSRLRQHRRLRERDHLHRRRGGHPALPRLSDRGDRRQRAVHRDLLPADLRPPAQPGGAQGVRGPADLPHPPPRGHEEVLRGLPARAPIRWPCCRRWSPRSRPTTRTAKTATST